MSNLRSALVVGAAPGSSLVRDLHRIGLEVTTIDAPEDALRVLRGRAPDVVVAALSLGGMGASSFCREARRHGPVPTVVAAPHDCWLEAINVGADGYVFVPCEVEVLNARIERAVRLHRGVVAPLLRQRCGRLTLAGRGDSLRVEPALGLSTVQSLTLGVLLAAGGAEVDAKMIEDRWRAADGDAPRGSVEAELEVLAALLARHAGETVIHRSTRGWQLSP